MSARVFEEDPKRPTSNNITQRMKSLIPPEEQWTPVDKALYGVEDVYRVNPEKAEYLRWEALKYSFAFHYEHNDFYRRYCQIDNITPDSIRAPADLTKIPMIPDSFFKDYPAGESFLGWLQKISSVKLPLVKLKRHPSFQDVMETLEAQELTVTFTSGTSGRFSFFPRNKTTWSRQKFALAAAVKDIVNNTYDPDRTLMLCVPHPDKTFNFLAKATSVAPNIIISPENIHCLINLKVTPDSMRISRGQVHGFKEKFILKMSRYLQARMVNTFITRLEQTALEKKPIALFGPPSIVESVMGLLEKSGKRFSLGDNAFVVTGGGWKLPTGAPMSDKQFRVRLKEFWGVEDSHCRDIYGMSECSAMMVDCEGHYKHIPNSILYPIVLGEDLKPVGYGQYGRFAFLDPIPESYPGFIITGDRVRMLPSCPVCKRIGPVIEPDISRMPGTEGRGCSTVMNQLMASELAKNSREK